jgi:hypothetical protein
VRDLDDVLRRCDEAEVVNAFGPVEFMPDVRGS